MKLRIELTTDNAAFEDWGAAVAGILRDLANELCQSRSAPDPAGGRLMDENGNHVGCWTLLPF